MGYLFYLLKKFINSYFFHVLFWYCIGMYVVFLILSTNSIFSDIMLVVLICFILVIIIFCVVILVKELYPEIKKAFKKSYQVYLQQKNTK